MNSENRQRTLVIAAILCFALFAGDKLIASPLIAYWQETAEDVAALRQSLAEGELLLSREGSLRNRWHIMQRDALPADKPQAESLVLQAVDHWVNESGVNILSFKPQWKDQDDTYFTLECRASLQGPIRSITHFLHQLESDPLSLKVEDIDLIARDETGNELTLTVVFSGLQFKPDTDDE
ncbi:MAG: hypothetical protein P9L94_04745 [Candidatus Hinthialibacter antarcticus]|nr:hypothetical protein [Candidatus Hinthialibacter antarcticus]